MKRFLLMALLVGLAAAPRVGAQTYNGIYFPAGDASFADRVLAYAPDYSGGATPTDPAYSNPAAALGRPDFVGDNNGTGGDFNGTGAVALGDGGRLELAFRNNVITNGATTGVDLAIYERGVAEQFAVAVHPANAATRARLAAVCATQYCVLGTYLPSNNVVALDLDAAFPGFAAGALRFDAVQLIDDLTQGAHSGDKVGADIDAAGAVTSSVIACGDGMKEGDEQCDDGDTMDGDGCSATCRIENCWTCDTTADPSSCGVNPGGDCDDGEPCTTQDKCGGPGGLTCIGGPPPNCDDGNVCTTDSCVNGMGCRWQNNSLPCDDGSSCSLGDHCVAGACVGTANESTGCRQSYGATQLRILNRLDDDSDSFVWTWPNGDATMLADFGDPPTPGGAYELCVFDGPLANRRLRVTARAENGQQCGDRGCWRLKGSSGYLFKTPRAPFGMRQLFLKSGGLRKSKILAKGRGEAIHLSADATMKLPVRVELRDTVSGTCWEAIYTSAVRNDQDRFKAKR